MLEKIMLNKKKEKQIEETKEPETPEEDIELREKTVPDINTAFTYTRDVLRAWVYPLCNLSKQEKYDLSKCVEYISDYIDTTEKESNVDIRIADYLQKLIADGGLQNYNKTYEENGYEISLTIKKVK